MKSDISGGLPAAELLDLETVRRLVAEIEWTPAQLADFYRNGTERDLKAIEEALARGDAGEVRRRAHGSAGASATCGIHGMSRLLRRLENAAEKGRTKEASDLVAAGRRLLAEVLAILATVEA